MAGPWSNEVQLNEIELSQESWFATVSPAGVLTVCWAQASQASVAHNEAVWYYCDYIRKATLNGTTPSAYTDLTTPSPPSATTWPAKKLAVINSTDMLTRAEICTSNGRILIRRRGTRP